MYKEAWKTMLEARYIVIASHMYPDGDTLGSTIALYHSLKQSGKKVALYNHTSKDLPKSFSFLEGYSKITATLPKEFDLLVSCDSSSFEQLGLQRDDFKIINLDHHKSNQLYGDINIVEEDFASTGLVVYNLFQQNDVVLSKSIAEALYSSMADDTGFFRYGNLDKKFFEAITELVKAGVNPAKVSENINSRVSLAKIRLRAYMLSNFALHHNATIATIVVSKEIQKKCGFKRSDTKNIISELRDIATVDIAIMFLEQDDYTKVSLRSSNSFDVSSISVLYGGGGHKNAAGFDIKTDDVEILKKEILKKIKRFKENET